MLDMLRWLFSWRGQKPPPQLAELGIRKFPIVLLATAAKNMGDDQAYVSGLYAADLPEGKHILAFESEERAWQYVENAPNSPITPRSTTISTKSPEAFASLLEKASQDVKGLVYYSKSERVQKPMSEALSILRARPLEDNTSTTSGRGRGTV